MKILLIHQAFVSGNEAGGTRHYELAQRLKSSGDEMLIIASQTSYLTGQRIHPERSGLFYRDDVEGIRVLRAYTMPVLHRGFIWRVLAFVIFSLTSVWAGLRAGKVDVVMGTSPPIFQALSAWVIALLRRRPFLLEIRDLWPEFAIDMGVLKNPFLIGLSRRLENFLYARAAHILVNSPAYRDYLLRKGVAPQKISFVANGVEVEMFNPAATGEAIRREYAKKLTIKPLSHYHHAILFFSPSPQVERGRGVRLRKFLVVYAGAHGPANDLDTVVRAASRLRHQNAIHFLMVGDGKSRLHLEAEAQRLNLTNLTFTGALPKTRIPDVLAAADACLATLMNIPMFTTTYPNKVFDYMAAGRPTILGIDGVIRDVIEKASGGIFVTPGDDAALAAAVEKLYADPALCQQMGHSAREYVAAHFNREQQAGEFRRVLQQVAAVRKTPLYDLLKRIIDLAVALVGLILASPIMLITAALIRRSMGSPVMFMQTRPGQHGKPFAMVKFRTMSDARDANGNFLSDEQRLTRLGQFLRSTSLDELPELLNVLKGDMSLVGPRPLLMHYLSRYTPEQARRHEVKPGITGWAQINGRNAITWEERLKLDVWYVDHRSLWLDIRIMAQTAVKVVRREGIQQEGEATMSEFKGSAPESENR